MSEANFFKVQASTAWIRTYAENHRFITRAEIGYLNTRIFVKFHRHYVSLRGRSQRARLWLQENLTEK